MYNLAHLISHLRRSETDIVFDVGANAGQFASEMFNAGFTGRIISFEPLSSAHESLQEAARVNPKWEIAPRCALGAKGGSAVINIAGNSYSSSLRPMLAGHLVAAPESAYIGTETTPVKTLASVIAQRFPEIRRFALKIDTQGFENEVLDGLGMHIEHCSALLLEMPLDSLYGGATDLPTLFSRLIRCGFRCVGLSPGHKNRQTGDAVEVDGLFVRDVSSQTQEFPLLTSVPPYLAGEALARQRAIITSWRTAGFKPISVNGPSELEQLTTLGLEIEIEPTLEDGKPFIGDILAAIRKRRCAWAGIVNADCELVGYPDLSLRLAASLENSVLYAERVDVGDDCAPTVGACNGFDAFFFDAGLLGTISDRHFRLGETWWDYWFPFQLAVNGAMLGSISIPLIYHRRHHARWDDLQWLHHGCQMANALETWGKEIALVSFFSSLADSPRLGQSGLHQLSRMGAACFQWLRTRRLPHELNFIPDEMNGIDILLRDAWRSFLNSGDLAAAKVELEAVKTQLANLEANLGAFRASTSWRVTAPMRKFVSLLRRNAGRSSSIAASK
jgi:FkbM family methyltransferase